MLPDNAFQIILKCFQRLHSKSSFLLLSGNPFSAMTKGTIMQKQKFVSHVPNLRKEYLEHFVFLLVI